MVNEIPTPESPPAADLPEVAPRIPALIAYTQKYPELWKEADSIYSDFVVLLFDKGFIPRAEADSFLKEIVSWWEDFRRKVVAPETFKEKIGSSLWDKIRDYLVPAFEAVLKSIWEWIKKTFSDFWDLIKEYIIPPLKDGLKWLNDQFENLGRKTYDGLAKLMQESGPITPERAPALALKVYGFAFSMGMAAHGVASGVELLHPLKRIGVHHIAAMLGDFAGYGRIAAATMGVMTSVTIAQPMQYAASYLARSKLPDDRLLQIMAVKPDIDIPTFRKGMAYMGYPDYWIDKVQRTMYHEPRYFELKMMSEDHAATGEWLYEKSRRAGFTEKDSEIMVSSYIKSATRTQRMDFYRQAFYLYKEGYIRPDVFGTLLAGLELRPEGTDFAARAADLAYMLDYTKDFVALYTSEFLKDIITEDELRLALVALGMQIERADLLVRKAAIRKRPKPKQPSPKVGEAALTKVQTKHVSLYTTLYRKGLIEEKTFLANLLQLGITTDLAEVTVALEVAKKLKPPAGS